MYMGLQHLPCQWLVARKASWSQLEMLCATKACYVYILASAVVSPHSRVRLRETGRLAYKQLHNIQVEAQ